MNKTYILRKTTAMPMAAFLGTTSRRLTMKTYEERERERFSMFWNATEITPDTRLNPCMTRDEFRNFAKVHNSCNDPKNSIPPDAIEIFFEFMPYYDISYRYSPSTATIYESWYYVGD